MEEDEELERLRHKRLQELQAEQELAVQDPEAGEHRVDELESQRKMLLRKILTPEARERLARLKLARPDFATAVEQQLILIAQTGRLGEQINDEMFRQILKKLQPKKKEITIKRR
ncbi:MAG: DNA-binding protein [Thermoplasmata archaeon]|nr:DNA-binding protein [Thermoplasmata archaeon]